MVPAPQLRYGEDGMDPVAMEGKGGEPVMFNRVLSVRCVRCACWAWHGMAASVHGCGLQS